ncbi:MAG: hypothetical protein R3277_05085 [Brumimicrobium sp.]|nr:hypothetical protein [Brumimicrobium sp.]
MKSDEVDFPGDDFEMTGSKFRGNINRVTSQVVMRPLIVELGLMTIAIR